jgi:hypothetical protein
MYPKPSDDMMQQVKSDKAGKRKEAIKKAKLSKSEKSQEQARKKGEIQADREAKSDATERKNAEK